MAIETEFTIDQFYKFGEDGKLMAAKCQSCKKIILPPRPICHHCYSDALEWIQLKGEGNIITYTVIHITTPELQNSAPYGVAIVKLAEGVPFIGMLKIKNHNEIKIGQKVSINFEKVNRSNWPLRPRIIIKPL